MAAVKAEGYVMGRIASDLEDHILANGDRLADSIADLLDGDEDNTTALRNLIGMVNDNAKLLHILGLVIRKDFAGAELEAMRLVAVNKAAAKP